MHGSLHGIRDAVETSFQTFDAVIECILNVSDKEGFVHLDVSAPGFCEGKNFEVERSCKIKCQLPLVTVISIGSCIDDRHRSGHSDLYWVVSTRLSQFVIGIQKMLTTRQDFAGNGR